MTPAGAEGGEVTFLGSMAGYQVKYGFSMARRPKKPFVELQPSLFGPELTATGRRVELEVREGAKGFVRLVIDGEVYREPLHGRPSPQVIAMCLEKYLASLA